MSARTFTLPRGMKDIEPEEMSRRLWLYDRIRGVVEEYGFQMVEPTTMENLETLEAKSGPAIRDEIYWFKDKADRNLGLRFDLTVGLARIVANRSDLPEPIKFAAIGGNWRYDEPQFGRYRYFTQWDIEIFGSSNPLADAEVICVGADILTDVGLRDFTIRISNRKLTESYLKQLGVTSGGGLEQALRIIDKLRKARRDQVETEFEQLKISDSVIEDIFTFISLNGSPSEVLARLDAFDFQNANAKDALQELRELTTALEAYGRMSACTYDMSIVRGIGYYDGIVFEAYDKGSEDIGSIFGGGRYDKLCGVYGKRDIPATGVAGGIERLMLSLERANLFPPTRPTVKVFIATVQSSSSNDAMKLVSMLRGSGIAAEMDLKQRGLSKQLEYVNAMRIPYVIVVGPQELQTKTFKVKQMSTGEETKVQLSELAETLRTMS